ncbi:MAG TPA: polyphosphate kinase 2 family protein [Armatimonadota bacterium]|jgi:PPK2 family polyphosphate:nucleotide phosphotransferase
MDRYQLKPGSKVRLSEWDPKDHAAFSGDKTAGLEELQSLDQRLAELQSILYAQQKHKLLVILQAMDTAGKDGVIKRVFNSVNPQGVGVTSFKAPTPLELAHDYLWRAHAQVPCKGEIGIFNRSYYEDVLVVRVHQLVPEKVWHRRYGHIRDFERMLVDEGTTILKIYLHIDQDEQKKRLQERLDTPSKRWKFNPDDLSERKLWKQYMEAYEEALTETSTDYAPWHILPSNREWYRNLMAARLIVEALDSLKLAYPEPPPGVEKVVIE